MTPSVLALGLLFGAAVPAPKPPAPMAPPDARVVLHLSNPKADLPALSRFLEPAGEHAPLLRPSSVSRLFSTALGADLFDRASLAAAGIDAERPLTLFLWQGQWGACFTETKDASAPTPPQSTPGAPTLKAAQFESDGARFRGLADPRSGDWTSGRVERHGVTCATAGASDQRQRLSRLSFHLRAQTSMAGGEISALVKSLPPAPLIGFFQTGHGLVGARFVPRKNGLDVQGRTLAGGEWLLSEGTHQTPVDASAIRAPLLATLALSPKARAPQGPLARRLSHVVSALCPACPGDARQKVLQELLEDVDVPIALALTGVDGKQRPNSLHQFRQALLLPLKTPDRARRAIASLLPKSVTPDPTAPDADARRLTLDGLPVHLGATDKALYFGNDPALLKRVLASPGQVSARRAKAQKRVQQPALHLVADGPGLADLLQSVSMFDMTGGQIFAALFFLKMEASALLRRAERLELTARPDGQAIRFDLAFDLRQPCRSCATRKR